MISFARTGLAQDQRIGIAGGDEFNALILGARDLGSSKTIKLARWTAA